MATVVLLVFLALSLAALLLTANAVLTLVRVGVPFVSTSRWVIRWLKDNLDLRDGQTLVELGCGDGRVLRALAQRFPRTTFIGYELGWWPVLRARLATLRLSNVKILRQDFFSVSLSRADVVYCYLFTSVMERLAQKLRAELRPGSRVYSFGFALPGWQQTNGIREPGRDRGGLLRIYTCPPRRA